MYKILKKRVLSSNVKLFVIDAPHVARRALAGQFIMLRIDENGERIPLTIADYDRKTGEITIIFQEVGKTTKQLGLLNEGDSPEEFSNCVSRLLLDENQHRQFVLQGSQRAWDVYRWSQIRKRLAAAVADFIDMKKTRPTL